MNRWKVSLLVLSFGLLVSTVFIPGLVIQSLAQVEVANPKQTAYSQYINCTGEIVIGDSEDVVLDVPVFASQVYVKNGDTVTAGQKLMDIDRTATVQYLASSSPTEVVSAFMSSNMSNLSMERVSELLSYNELTEEVLNKYLSSDIIPTGIYAPCDGKISNLGARSGEITAPLSTIVSISKSDDKMASLAVTEANISVVRVGQKVTISGLAFPQRQFTGEIVEIASTARKTLNGTNIETVVDVAVRLDNGDDTLKPGYTARGKISLTEDKRILTVPYEYVLQDSNGDEFVYIYENGKAVKRVILTGLELSSGFEILDGLDEYSQIITSPEQISSDNEYVRLLDGE